MAIDPVKPLPLISFERIMQDELPPVEWLVDGLIAKGDRVVVYGEFRSMKSWLLLHLGLHLAAGRSWLGKFDISVPQRTRWQAPAGRKHWRLLPKEVVSRLGIEPRTP